MFLSVLTAISILSEGQTLFGVFAGAQATSVKYTIQDVKQSAQYKQGFQMGAGVKVPFDNQLCFTPAVFYSLKGYKVKFNRFSNPPDTAAVDNNTRIHTIELAALLQFDFGNQSNHFFLKAGPSLDGQIAGKERFNLKNGGYVDRKMKFSFFQYGYVGINLLLQLGYETKGGLTIFGQYTHGVSSINNADGGPQINHRAFGISIGQYFQRKKA